MTSDDDGFALAVPGADSAPAWGALSTAPGALELALERQIAALTAENLVTDLHAARIELARSAARDLDRSVGRGAPSGRANLLRVYNEVLDGLPQPETASEGVMDELVSLLRDGEDAPAGHAG